MNVKELREFLADKDDEMLLIVQKDAEGNGYSPLEGADDNCAYVHETAWYGEVYLWELDEESRRQGFCEEDVRTEEDGAVPVIVLYPVN